MIPIPLTLRHLQAASTPLPSGPVQQLWFALQARPWSTLAVVATEIQDAACPLAAALVRVGRLTHVGEIDLVNVCSAALPDVAHHLEAIAATHRGGPRLVVAVEPVLVTPISLPLLRAADAVVLVLTLGRSTVRAAIDTVQLVGRDRFLGCVLLDPGIVP